MPPVSSDPSSPPAAAGEAWAWLDAGTAGHFSASGQFTAAAEPAPDRLSFYVNDFALTGTNPWRIPEITPAPGSPEAARPVVAWEQPSAEAFRPVFDELMDAVRDREILKAVPVAASRGHLLSGDMGAWMRRLVSRPPPGTHGLPFAWVEGPAGFGGFTPEILFRIDGRTLTTMALAGTTDADHAAELTERPKLAREHAVVVDELQRRLAVLGDVTTGGREIVRQGNIRHLRTSMEVTLAEAPSGAALNDLIRLLHPTPALGISPRTEASVALLARCRDTTGTPAAFGAPFGVAWPGGALFAVAIRGVFWEAGEVVLPSGGGLVAGSEFAAEWAELELKRAWVGHTLGLASA